MLKLGANVGEGIAKKVPELIPTADNLYSISKQTLIGLPFELLLSGIDKLCTYRIRKQASLSRNGVIELRKQVPSLLPPATKPNRTSSRKWRR